MIIPINVTFHQVLPLIEKSSTVTHEQFKGAMYIIIQNQLVVRTPFLGKEYAHCNFKSSAREKDQILQGEAQLGAAMPFVATIGDRPAQREAKHHRPLQASHWHHTQVTKNKENKNILAAKYYHE